MKKIWLGLFGAMALCWASVAQAQERVSEEEVSVDADSMEMQIDEKGNILVLEGNVRLMDAEWSMEANKIIIHMKKGGLNLDELAKKDRKDSEKETGKASEGEPGENGEQRHSREQDDGGMSFKSVEATGGVVVRTLKGSETAYGDSAFFDGASRVVTLQGDCEIRQDRHILRGEKVEFDIKKQTFKLTSFKGRLSLKKDGNGGNTLGGLLGSGFKDKEKDKGKDKGASPANGQGAGEAGQENSTEQEKR
ncbi:MAG: hypothetical protein IJJ33_20305 [Victivallales bacterium]|nr:hypothetical protein [Victivallales bacterium]